MHVFRNPYSVFISLCFIQVLIITSESKSVNQQGLFDDSHVFLTLHELASMDDGNVLGRELELNWANLHFQDYRNHRIELFDHDPEEDPSTPLCSFAVCKPNGTIKTNVRFEVTNFTDVKIETCYKFWIGYFLLDARADNNCPYRSNCLRLYPDWMNRMKGVIGNKPLRKLMIPGTHNAGAWIVYDGTQASSGLVEPFVYTQEENIYNQLISGIRYLDVRVACYTAKNTPCGLSESSPVFFVNHDLYRIRELKYLLEDVRKFVTEFKEVVFMDFHRFPVGVNSEAIHEKLYKFVLVELEHVLAPKSLTVEATFNQLLSSNKYVILTYHNEYHKKQDLLWGPLTHGWPNTNQLEELKILLPEKISQFGCTKIFWSAMAELTPQLSDIIYKNDFRKMANKVNKPLNEWYKQPKWYSKSNIVSTDFYLGNDLIQTSLKVNANNGVIC
ncbi:unnamed protein product [Allacma fusca]|uniref:Uncharacterized protein n=1 Tax=Allacma fusca TaxID=39272 RepID=A0A8J2KGJ7_9HEXA|nr:unnamed protein product [Allacma fusca]